MRNLNEVSKEFDVDSWADKLTKDLKWEYKVDADVSYPGDNENIEGVYINFDFEGNLRKEDRLGLEKSIKGFMKQYESELRKLGVKISVGVSWAHGSFDVNIDLIRKKQKENKENFMGIRVENKQRVNKLSRGSKVLVEGKGKLISEDKDFNLMKTLYAAAEDGHLGKGMVYVMPGTVVARFGKNKEFTFNTNDKKLKIDDGVPSNFKNMLMKIASKFGYEEATEA